MPPVLVALFIKLGASLRGERAGMNLQRDITREVVCFGFPGDMYSGHGYSIDDCLEHCHGCRWASYDNERHGCEVYSSHVAHHPDNLPSPHGACYEETASPSEGHPGDYPPHVPAAPLPTTVSTTVPNTTTTATTTPEPEKVKIGFSIAGVTPESLANTLFKEMLTLNLRRTIASSAGVPEPWVDIAFVGVSSFMAKTRLKRTGGVSVEATITIVGGVSMEMGVAITPASITHNVKGGSLASVVTQSVKEAVTQAIAIGEPLAIDIDGISTTPPDVTTITPPVTPPVDVSSYGDPHCKNLHGNRFDIQRPGNHSFVVLPRGANQGRANLHVEASVTRRGGLCTGK
eukprot:CAMPEP_0168373234 /NCGR_PEP_ID=MMETSP0228-20121227/8684_1 /TAXON_ID=133427 /ORGANISM="Protoceratium reticulatum, Strain CCCM 535 (=CCMP 1889)" /LENGTH=344 /DNA_ID=CAMNT_0008386151 /DNA_START=64 /DNA_END=1095 /DNA_ORIENTATION=+